MAASVPGDAALGVALASQGMHFAPGGLVLRAPPMPLLRGRIIAMGSRRHRRQPSPTRLARRRGGRGQRPPHQRHDRGGRISDLAGLMEEAELMRRTRPDLGEQRRIERRAVGDHLLRTDPRLLEPRQKGGDSGPIHRAIHQRIADQAIARWRGGIDGQQEGQLALIHLV